ncbi:TPA: hypothetical protein RCG86_000062 [Enterobacter roggenkampii]|nr:hypothetical protein [Enterobacter roggenkampii]
MIMAVISTLASLASLLGLAFQLIKNKEKPLTYCLLAISFVFSIASACLWVENENVGAENKALKNARVQAEQLISTWPDVERFNFVTDGEFRGIVISGMAFLESKKELFPDTYQTAKSLLFIELEAAENKDNNYVSKRAKLEEAARTMITTIKGIQLNKSAP